MAIKSERRVRNIKKSMRYLKKITIPRSMKGRRGLKMVVESYAKEVREIVMARKEK